MKLIKRLVLITSLLILFPTVTIFADTTGTAKPATPVILYPKKPAPISNKPKSPSQQYIEFTYYTTDCLGVFNFQTDITSMFVEIENLETGETYYDTVDASYPCMNVTLTSASYSVTCTTDDESIYTGAFDIM